MNWHTTQNLSQKFTQSYKNFGYRTSPGFNQQHNFNQIFSSVQISAKIFCLMTIATKGVILFNGTPLQGFFSTVINLIKTSFL
jgi:hypothetical protein